MEYFLGVDIGGSKTHAALADSSGRVLGFGESGSGNHEIVGYEGMVHVLKESTQVALNMAGLQIGEVKAGGFGIAGYDWPSERAPMLASVGRLGINGPVEIANDTMIGLLAGASKGWGVVVDAGTGDNCMGRDWNGREAQMTGCGPLFAEFGGAGSLVMRAIQRISLEWGHRGPATGLTQAFVKYMDAKNVDDLLEGLGVGYYHVDAEAAPLVFKVAEEGDQVAVDAIAWAGKQLASMVIGITRQLHFEELEFEVVCIGSMFNGGALLMEPLKTAVKQVAPRAQFVRLNVPPVVGGVLLAMEKAGKPFDNAIRLALSESIADLLKGKE